MILIDETAEFHVKAMPTRNAFSVLLKEINNTLIGATTGSDRQN